MPLKLALAFLGSLLLAIASHAPAAGAAGPTTYTWTGATSSNWSVATNWNPATGTPATGDSVIFPSGGANTHTNNDISSGTLASLATITFQSGATGYFITGNAVGVTGSITVNAGAGSNQIDSQITGAGSVAMNGTLLTLTNTTNTFSGGTTINAGSVSAASGALGIGTVTLAGGSLQGNGSGTTLANAIIVSSASTIGGSLPLTLTGAVSGTGNLTLNCPIMLTLSPTTPNTFSGTLAVTSGGMLAFNSNGLGTGPISLNAGSLQPSAGITWNNPITLAGPGLIDVGTATSTANGVISGSSGLAISGAGGTLNFGAANTYTGGTVLGGTGVTLVLPSTGSMPTSGAVTISSGSTLNLSGVTTPQTVGNLLGSGSLTLPPLGLTVGDSGVGLFTGTISGTGALTKAGAGNLTLGGTNTYTGATTVNAGTLLVNSTLTTSTVTVNSGGALSGGGTLGIVTVNSGGVLSPTVGLGNLTVANITFTPGSTFFTGLGGSNVNTAANGYSQLTVTGTANLGGATLSVNLFNGFQPTVGQVFTVLNGPVTGTFNGIAQGGTVSDPLGDTYTVAYGSVVLTTKTVATTTPTTVSTPVSVATPTSSGGGTSSTPSLPTIGQTLFGTTPPPPGVIQSLTSIGLANVTIPPVPPPGVAAAPADVPVPLAPLNQGALVLPVNTGLTTQLLSQIVTATAPVAVSAAINSGQGGVIIAGNAVIVLTSASFNQPPPQPGVTTPNAPVLQVAVLPQPANLTAPGGPTQYSPHGTVLDIKITDQATGQQITTFAAPLQLTLKPNAADIGQSGGHPETLTAAYVIDAQSPAIENPLGFPIGTFVIFPPSNVVNDGTMVTVLTRAMGSTVAVVTNPVGYVQTVSDAASVNSSFDPNSSQTFGTKSQFSYLQVVEPQIGGRLLVLDPDTGNYGYVNATDVGPSGPPPPRTSSAVVRGLAGPPPKPRSGPPPAMAQR